MFFLCCRESCKWFLIKGLYGVFFAREVRCVATKLKNFHQLSLFENNSELLRHEKLHTVKYDEHWQQLTSYLWVGECKKISCEPSNTPTCSCSPSIKLEIGSPLTIP